MRKISNFLLSKRTFAEITNENLDEPASEKTVLARLRELDSSILPARVAN